MAGGVQLAVLNPGGRDREQTFPDFAGDPGAAAHHPPVNYHAYAACTGGAFYRDPARIPAGQRAILLVLRRDLGRCLAALRQLKSGERKIAVSLKESGLHQVARLLDDAGNLALFREICGIADGCLSSTQELAGIYRAAGGRNVRFIPTPYPVDARGWDFALPLAERAGVFIGTREWDVPSRNHAAALLLAARLGGPVTIINEDGRSGRRRIEAAGIAKARIMEGRVPYADYLRLMARHRIVLQLDRGAVPGQVAGDALLCGLPCVGGDGAIERIAFPDLCGLGRGAEELGEIAALLLRDDAAWTKAVERSREVALARVSFAAVAGDLAGYFSRI